MAVFLDWEVGSLLRGLGPCFVEAELSAPHHSVLLPLSYLEFTKMAPE